MIIVHLSPPLPCQPGRLYPCMHQADKFQLMFSDHYYLATKKSNKPF